MHGLSPDKTNIVLGLDLAHDSTFHLVLPQLDLDRLQVAHSRCNALTHTLSDTKLNVVFSHKNTSKPS